MNKIDTTNWKEFKTGELFDIHPTKAYRLTNTDLFESAGHNPVIVNSSYNNGVGGYTSLETTEIGNIITFSDTTSSDAIFFQELDFVGYPHVQGMYPIGKYKDLWGKYSMLFFVSLFKSRANCLNYDYVNKFTRDSAKQITIKLPVDITGNPDFSYMEKYMKNLEVVVGSSLTALQSARDLENYEKDDAERWKTFVITDFFEPIKVSNKLSKLDFADEGIVPVQSSESFNNGILGYTERDAEFLVENGEFFLIFGDHTKSINIADYSFCVMDNVKVLKPKILNKWIVMFITTIWKKAIPDLGYARHWTLAKNIKFKLPVDTEGNPDFSYMEVYEKNIEKKMKANIQRLNAV